MLAKEAQHCHCKRGQFNWAIRLERLMCTLTMSHTAGSSSSGNKLEKERWSLSLDLCCSPTGADTTQEITTDAEIKHLLLMRGALEESHLLITEPVKSSSWPMDWEIQRELVLKIYSILLCIDQVEVSCSAKQTSIKYFRFKLFLMMAQLSEIH